MTTPQDELTAVLAQLASERAAHVQTRAALEAAQIEALKVPDLLAQVAKLREYADGFEAAVAKRVCELGISKTSPDFMATTKTREEALHEYGQLTDARERGAYFAKHRDLLLGT